jgi:eukaryotic-like serine/threonine-protein kinase
MEEQNKDRVGQQFGNYQLMRFLGRGGFAEVYIGQHAFLKTQVALKILHAQLAHDEQERFLQEARTIAHLVHPHIIRVLDFGLQGDQPFLVMDYAPHGSLRDRYPKGAQLGLETIITYTKQIASALQSAHDAKLIHCDVKPENMLVGRNGDVLLGDFGIAVVAQSTHSQHTQEVIGSVPYMAPEQLQGKPRFASDQYALGVVVYEWLCGNRPFQGSFTEIYGQHIFGSPPSLRSKNPAISSDIESVVMTALAKDVHQRFDSIWAFAYALEQAYRSQAFASGYTPAQELSSSPDTQIAVASPSVLAGSLPVTSTKPFAVAPTTLAPTETPIKGQAIPHRRIPRRAVLASLGAGALLILGGGGVAWYTLSHHYLSQGTWIYTYPEHSDSVLTVAWHSSRIASGSKDQTVQVWDATTGNNPHVYRHHSEAVNSVAWSPNGQSIASGSDDGTAQVWNASATTPVVVYKGHMQASGFSVHTVAWSPDGQFIASGGDDGTVQVWKASNGQRLFTYNGHINNGSTFAISSIAWSPDGTRIASGGNDNTVQIWHALTGKNASVYKGHQGGVTSVSWSPNGMSVASGSVDNTVHIWGLTTQSQAFIYAGHIDTVSSVAWSLDGQFVASASNDKTVRIWNPNDVAKLYIYARHSAAVNTVAWADDSHRLVSGGDDKTVQVWEGV